MSSLTLDQVKPGQVGRVVRVDTEGEGLSRLLELGLIPGIPVKVLRRAPMGDPLQIEVAGASFALRGEVARHIAVELETGGDA